MAVNLLLALVFAAALVAGFFGLLGRWFPAVSGAHHEVRAHVVLDAALKRCAVWLALDPTPESDSPEDPIWRQLSVQNSAAADETGSSPVIELEDASSKINPNWVRKNLFERTSLSALFSPVAASIGSPSDHLQQLREDRGFFCDLEVGYGSLFSAETRTKYLTAWSYANINLTDEFVLQRLCELRTGNAAAAETFHTSIQRLLQQGKILHEEELEEFFGTDYRQLYPVVNALPWWNVHYLPPLILRQILSYPGFRISDPAARADRILAACEKGEVSPKDLQSLVGAPADHIIYQYLGTVTWFWKITIVAGSDRLEAVLCRLPPAQTNPDSDLSAERPSPTIFRVVARRYTP